MCVESFFLINQAMDLVIITAVARSLGGFRLRRAWIASSFAALYATLTLYAPPLAHPAVQLALVWPVARLSTGRTRASFNACAGLATVALSTGACAGLMSANRFTPAALLLPSLLCLGAPPVQRGRVGQTASVEILRRGMVARFSACVDTGNRLIEPLSGQPVLIASAALLRDVLPERGYRQVAYGSVGGGGRLHCFRPDDIYIWVDGHRRRAPEAWIAVYPGRLPGAFQALTPAAFACLR